MSLIFSPVMLVSSRMTLVVFQTMALKKYLFEIWYHLFVIECMRVWCSSEKKWLTSLLGEEWCGKADLAGRGSLGKCRPTFEFVPAFYNKSDEEKKRQHPLCCWCTLSAGDECTGLTWDRLGWWELRRVLVSTCSGTRPWFLRTCRASRSLAGPKCWCITVLASAGATELNKIQVNWPKIHT